MRKFILLTCLSGMLSMISLSSCTDMMDEERVRKEMSELEKRIELLEKLQERVDLIYQVLAAQEHKFVSSIEDFVDESGKKGIKINFSDGDSLIVWREEEVPDLMVKESEGNLYWWLGDDWLYLNGEKVTVQSARPQFRIEEGVWMVSFDGTLWSEVNVNSEMMNEVRIDGRDENYVVITIGETEVKVPWFRPSSDPETKFDWWHYAKFGMFIHWGPNTLRGKSDWAMGYDKLPVEEYYNICKEFNPSGSMDEWIKLAKEAGQKYAVMVTKHHDGYSQFFNDSKFSCKNYSVGQRDYVDEFVKACRKYGLKFGFYYSHAQDWSHPGGFVSSTLGGAWDEAQQGSFDTYLQKVAEPHVELLLKRYSDCSIFWFDTPGGMNEARANRFKAIMDKYPHVIYNDRIGGGLGEFTCPELNVPEEGYPGKRWETCMTMNNHWSYYEGDENWKSPQTIIRMLIDIVSKGGNLLLNIGPDKEGIVPVKSQEILREVGAWMKINGESLYGTDLVSPFRNLSWNGRVTGKENKLYLHIYDWVSGGKILLPLGNIVSKVYLLQDSRSVSSETKSTGTEIILPELTSPDKNSQVIVVEYEGNSLVIK